jgi:hypothetical protein
MPHCEMASSVVLRSGGPDLPAMPVLAWLRHRHVALTAMVRNVHARVSTDARSGETQSPFGGPV